MKFPETVKGIRPMTDFEKTYQNYNPRQAALDEARALLTAAAKAAMADGALPEAELPAFIVEIPADVKNGDIASNLAMAGARTWRKAPKMIADALLAHLPSLENSVFSKVEVAGPGFINLFLSQSFWAGVVLGACANKEYGRTDHGKGAKYNVEFVSANPTGPMHMGNARGGALGDCLAAVLDWSGYDVTREFYINDAGNQIQKFGKSLAVRYLQQFCGEEAYPLPKECYQGGDIKVLAGEFAELNGDKYVAACKGMDEEALFESEAFAALKDALVAYALPKNIAALKRDLGKYRIDYDVWFHESTLHESGAVLAVVDKLLELGACYKAEDGAIMYRSAQYAAKYGTVNKKKTEDGTEEEAKDEVLVRANGIPTYFAADIAYHYNKLATRGFAKAIDVWGADHHGHVARMKGAMDAIGLNGNDLDVVLMQMVNLMRDGQPVRMSKRTGKAISLTDLLDGYVARHYNQVSDFGKFADPLADKCLVMAALCWFVETGDMVGWVLAVVLLREFAVSGMRLIAVEKGRVIAAGWSGKVKTASTMVCICLMLFGIPHWLNLVCQGIILVTTVYSGVEYFAKNWDVFQEKK